MGKKLGQYFLKSNEAIKKIVAALELKTGETVIEIGAGHGELTEELGVRCPSVAKAVAGRQVLGVKIIAIERDEQLVQILKKKFEENKNIEIIEGDVRKELKAISEKCKVYKLVGNIPYYLTGYLLRQIGELKNKPEVCVLTIQKEVAERIIAQPPKMNRLAASIQFWAIPEIILTLPRSVFKPEPGVESAVIRLKVIGDPPSLKASDGRSR